MATVEHCLCCFEALAAELENRDALSLEDVQKSYGAYLASLSSQADDDSLPKKSPALRRLAVAAAASSSASSLGSSSGSSTTSLLSANTAATSLPASPAPGAAAAATKITDPTARYPLFVTWDKRHGGSSGSSSSDEYHLRGCIGTFSADSPLDATLPEYALVSALHDTRFDRVAARELPLLRCSVTLLTDFEPCADVDDWVLGEHGIRISFALDGSARRLGATYLPQVAPEQGWDRDETMESLMRKAGWRPGGGGRRGAAAANWREVAERGGMRVERYRGDKEDVDWDEFKAWRDWVEENWANEA